MKLYLDDLRPCPTGWKLALSVSEAVLHVTSCLQAGEEWTHASLDHDLAVEHYLVTPYGSPPQTGTGCDFVDWMIEHNIWPTNKPTVHSQNPKGAALMRASIDRYWELRNG